MMVVNFISKQYIFIFFIPGFAFPMKFLVTNAITIFRTAAVCTTKLYIGPMHMIAPNINNYCSVSVL